MPNQNKESQNLTLAIDNTSGDSHLLRAYQESVEAGELNFDSFQLKILEDLQQISDHLTDPKTKQAQRSSFMRLFSRKADKSKPKEIQKGLYLWGGVGRGKTHLVDMFFEKLQIQGKLRLHFHRFMQIVHDELSLLDGVEDPLKRVAGNISKETRLLCLDELHVIDITDAMLLGRLFKYLFESGLVLVTTSNFHPDDLYKNGLQRSRFLPAIALLKQHAKVTEMQGDMDYRSRALKKLGSYYILSSDTSEEQLEKDFHRLSGVELHQDRKDIFINKRHIPVKMWSNEVAWFDFDELCNTPRAADDYREIATFFNTVLISDIPQMNQANDDAARRFINMIDIFYDMHINIVVSAATAPEKLYTGEKLNFEFQRAISRIKEMQTIEYITDNTSRLESIETHA